MTALLYDGVWETTTTTGTGAYTLAGAKSSNYLAFGDVVADNAYPEYFCRNSDRSIWERGWGQYDSGADTLTRNLIESSTGSLIDWGSGTKEIYIAPPAKSLNDDRGVLVAESNPDWFRANTLRINPSTNKLLHYDGENDIEIPQNYAEGTWTPALTFETPGNLNVAYTSQAGSYTRVGRLVTVNLNILTSTFTHTTASGVVKITGLPATSVNTANRFHVGTCIWQGITKASFSDVRLRVVANTTEIDVVISGSGQTLAQITAADMPTGGTVRFIGTLTYEAA